MASPVRLTSGVTNAKKVDPFGDFIAPDPTKTHIYFEDFDYFTAADWTITTVEAGAGSASEGIIDGDGGLLLITNDDADDDSDFLNKVGESYQFETGKKLWFEARFSISDATQSDAIMGLQRADTTPLDVADGIFFIKNDGAATIDLVVEKDNVATTTSAVATLGDSVTIRLGYFYNGVDAVKIFADGVQVGTSVTTNLPDDEALTISFGIQNGEAVAKLMAVDYIMVAKER